MFDPKQLAPDFRKQLLHSYRRPKLWTFRVPEAEILEHSFQDDEGLELIYEPPTPPNTPSATADPSPRRKKRSEGKMEPGSPRSPGSPTPSPSWLLRQMRIPSLTSEISELSGEGVELRRSSTLTQEGQAKVCQ